jgi:hypothetical protein
LFILFIYHLFYFIFFYFFQFAPNDISLNISVKKGTYLDTPWEIPLKDGLIEIKGVSKTNTVIRATIVDGFAFINYSGLINIKKEKKRIEKGKNKGK